MKLSILVLLGLVTFSNAMPEGYTLKTNHDGESYV